MLDEKMENTELKIEIKPVAWNGVEWNELQK